MGYSRYSAVRHLLVGLFLSAFLFSLPTVFPLLLDTAVMFVDTTSGSDSSGGASGPVVPEAFLRLVEMFSNTAALVVMLVFTVKAGKAFISEDGYDSAAREARRAARAERREARKVARAERKGAAADALLEAESSGSVRVLLAAARKKDAAAVELWLRFENDLALLLSVPELVRVDGSLRSDSLGALESLMAARSGVESGVVSEAEYLRVSEESLAVVERCVREAELLKDSAFSVGEQSSLRVAREVVGSSSSGEAAIVDALSGLGFLELPVAAVSGVMGDRMLGARVVKSLEAVGAQKALPAGGVAA